MSRLITALLLSALTVGANAELNPISDEQMSEVTGQAFVSIDRQYHPSANDSTAYTRVNLGMDIDVQANVDLAEVGKYSRAGETNPSDVDIGNLSLGYIQNQAYYADNDNMPRQRKPDGSAYADGEIVPFSIENPYFEFAQDEGTGEVVGFRMGFGEAQGVLSGDIQALTGNVNIQIEDTAQGLSNLTSGGSFADRFLIQLGPAILGNSPISARAQLAHGPDSPNAGELDPVRATHAGLPNDHRLELRDVSGFLRNTVRVLFQNSLSSRTEYPNCTGLFSCGTGPIYVYADNCQLLGVNVCFKLENYNSFPLGEINQVAGESRLTGPVDGVFLSFQTKDLDWLKDVRNKIFRPRTSFVQPRVHFLIFRMEQPLWIWNRR